MPKEYCSLLQKNGKLVDNSNVLVFMCACVIMVFASVTFEIDFRSNQIRFGPN